MDDNRIQWHPGFTAAMKLELIRYAEQLTFHEEYLLNAKPIQMDLLIIEKKEDLVIENVIARHFRRYNVFEYKSPEDEMNIDTFFKVNAYACLYKASAHHVNQIRAEDILVTLVRAHRPAKLLEWLQKNYEVREDHPGIYYIAHAGLFPAQIIVSDELLKEDAIWLQSLTNRLQSADAKKLLANIEETRYGRNERELIESVLQVLLAANREAFDEMRKEEPGMYDALRDFMAADFQKAENKGEERAKRETAIRLADMGMSVDKIADAVESSEKQVEEWLSGALVTA